ncbi:MAG TPA: DPP IV N-terminal domain-containing protein, partial [Anaerolineales bacterium]|nr:DPP IV N-terminal domain-containing protein [Anaerolineales bacterium]
PPPPSLFANGSCVYGAGVAQFNITNNGGDMKSPYKYTITDSAGNIVQSGTVQLKAGESLTLKVSGTFDSLLLTILDGAGTTVLTSMANCAETGGLAVAPAEPQVCIQCLIFHTFRDDNLEVYRLDGVEGQPGFKLYNLSQDEAVDSRPSRAPNDSWVVFQSNRDGNVELYYTDLLGSGEAIRLTDTEANNTNPMYGPDAETIVFQSDRNGRSDLFTIDQNTGEEVQLTSSSADDVNPFFSPDINKLVFQSNRNGNWDLFVLDLETGTDTQLTNSTEDETFPAWSSNGKQIAYIKEVNGATDLYVIDLETGTERQLTNDGKTTNAVWSPEGDRIAYQSERSGNLDIYSYDFRDNKEYRVTDFDGKDSGPTWDCGGTNLAFTSVRDGDLNIFQVFWQGGSAGNMTIDPASDKWSQWRPSNDISSVGY